MKLKITYYLRGNTKACRCVVRGQRRELECIRSELIALVKAQFRGEAEDGFLKLYTTYIRLNDLQAIDVSAVY